ncbi:MAG: 16S rRNA (guanine(527)-N(7))-methyltransferase RsmG [Syntrophomonadaceae bacterium]|nr:16S rRNA (guanine(527)-N(7))-methyltransferase RsmG [Syntrophomonadaceae bacterium]
MEINVNRFKQLLEEENKKQNLISRKTGPEEIEQHVKDSLQVLQWISLSGRQVVDIGSGAGFPGLILALACPDCYVTLVESDLKKSGFLKYACTELNLSNVEIIRDRAEILGQSPEHRNRYDVCTSRAVAAMRIMLEYGIPLVKPEGMLLLWKGSGYQQEIADAQNALKALGGIVEEVYFYKLLHERDRAIVVVKKAGPTPPQYPRKVGVPSKKPL